MTEFATLPYVPEPYSDEVLGSWIARTAQLTGSGAWRSMLEHAGYGHKLQSPLFDLTDSDPRLDALLVSMGTNYDSIVRQHTTSLFWSAFAGSESAVIPGTYGLPMPTRQGLPVRNLFGLGTAHSAAAVSGRWHCPLCLAEDIDKGRHPYWRRSHQLPTVHYCPTHWVALENMCPSCSASTTPVQKGGAGTLSTRCDCGFDLRNSRNPLPTIPLVFRRLCQISVASLELEKIEWDRLCVRDVVRNRLKRDQAFAGMSTVQVLGSQFPGGKIGRYGVVVRVPGTGRDIHLVGESPNISAMTWATLLAILDVQFSDAAQAFRRAARDFKVPPAPTPIQAQAEGLDVPTARRLLLAKMQASGRSVSQYGTVYWYLRLFDEAWLHRNVRSKLRDYVPSIKEDRQLLENGLGTAQSQTRVGGTTAALYRARLRDQAWLNTFKTRRRQQAAELRNGRLQALHDNRKKALRAALSEILASEKRPRRITYGSLGKHVGLTYLQTMLQVKADPELQSTIAEANGSKIQRQLRWALRVLEDEGALIGSVSIFRRAGLPPTPATSPFVRELVTEAKRRAAASQ